MECYKLDSHFENKLESTESTDILIQFAVEQSLFMKNILDQTGLAYHRVFSHNSIEVFQIFIADDFDIRHDNFPFLKQEFQTYINELSQLQSKFIYIVDEAVIKTIDKEMSKPFFEALLERLFKKPNQFVMSAKQRFESIISPVIESVFIK